jgi:hypothetical protein
VHGRVKAPANAISILFIRDPFINQARGCHRQRQFENAKTCLLRSGTSEFWLTCRKMESATELLFRLALTGSVEYGNTPVKVRDPLAGTMRKGPRADPAIGHKSIQSAANRQAAVGKRRNAAGVGAE